jgi:hypothetical protein
VEIVLEIYCTIVAVHDLDLLKHCKFGELFGYFLKKFVPQNVVML